MKKKLFSFRSILVKNVEKVIPGTVRTTMVLEMDDESVESHTLEISLSEILLSKSLLTGGFLSLIIVVPISVLITGIIYFATGKGADAALWNSIKLFSMISSFLIFIIVCLLLTYRFSLSDCKRKSVEKARGKGNWRIVDEKEWEKFYRLLMIAKKARERESLIK